MRGRIPGRDEEPLDWIIDQWGLNLAGPILELGPGNGQLERRVRAARGTWFPVDKDEHALPMSDWACYPTLLDFEQQPSRLPGGPFAGVFCRNSIGAHWVNLPLLAREISQRMSRNTWAWISIWTGGLPEDVKDMEIEHGVLRVFESHGFVYDGAYERPNQVLVTRCL